MPTLSIDVARAKQWSSLSDEQVVERVLAGETALYEVLMRRHNQRVYRAIRAIIKDEAEVEEAMQQTYIAAYSHLRQFDAAAKFSTWLTRIAINEALGRRRRAGQLTLVEDATQLESEPMSDRGATDNPEENTSRRELAGLLEQAIDSLPELYRSALVLREVEGMSTAEAALVLGVSDDVLKMRLHRAKQRVRDTLYNRIHREDVELFAFYAPRCDRVVASVLETIHQLPAPE